MRWTESCPLQGKCPECGLEFAWADVLLPERSRLTWMYEHKRDWSPALGRAMRTLANLALPWRFWARVTLAHEVRPWRALWFAVLIIGGVWFVTGVLGTLGIWAIGRHYPYYLTANNFAEAWVWPVMNTVGVGLRVANIGPLSFALNIEHWGAAVFLVVGFWVGMPAVLCLLSTTRQISAVRGAHIARAACYAALPLAAIALPRLLMNVEILINAAQNPPGRWQALSWLVRHGSTPLGVASAAWTLLWWWFTISRGLRLAPAWLVFGLLCTCSVLLSLVLLVSLGTVPVQWILAF